MKIFFTSDVPNVHFYYKVLTFIRQHACKDELKFYVEQVCKKAREENKKHELERKYS